jgi:hypothetical protein
MVTVRPPRVGPARIAPADPAIISSVSERTLRWATLTSLDASSYPPPLGRSRLQAGRVGGLPTGGPRIREGRARSPGG